MPRELSRCRTEWLICESDKRNITAYVNQSQVPPDPHMCKDIKWGHYEPDRAVDQMYLVNPTDVDRFSIKYAAAPRGPEGRGALEGKAPRRRPQRRLDRRLEEVAEAVRGGYGSH